MPRRTLLFVILVAAFLVIPIWTAPVPLNRPVKEITNSIGMRLVRIEPGKFMMGSAADEKDRRDCEHLHEVEITKPFYMGVHPVTQMQFKEVMGYNPSYFSRDGEGQTGVKYNVKPGEGKDQVAADTSKFPVEQVSWDQAVTFCENLTALANEKGRVYRLPTEAEWEYTCRAGTKTKYHSGDKEDDLKKVGWYDENSKGRTHTVEKKQPNKWSLYDMHGNVSQWCSDRYDKDYQNSDKQDPKWKETGDEHVLRGGSWFYFPSQCRTASRDWADPRAKSYVIGFRVVCVPSDK